MSSEDNFIANAENTIACDAISEKLIEVSRVAESLDGILHETQDGLDIFECTLPVATTSTTTTAADRKASYANNSDVSFLNGNYFENCENNNCLF